MKNAKNPQDSNLAHRENTPLNLAIDHCLEHAAEPRIPIDFAAKVAAALPPVPARRRSPFLARKIAFAAAALLLLALFALAPHSSATLTNTAFDLELLLLVQLIAVAWWLAVRRRV
jgi:hypothetical protein